MRRPRQRGGVKADNGDALVDRGANRILQALGVREDRDPVGLQRNRLVEARHPGRGAALAIDHGQASSRAWRPPPSWRGRIRARCRSARPPRGRRGSCPSRVSALRSVPARWSGGPRSSRPPSWRLRRGSSAALRPPGLERDWTRKRQRAQHPARRIGRMVLSRSVSCGLAWRRRSGAQSLSTRSTSRSTSKFRSIQKTRDRGDRA